MLEVRGLEVRYGRIPALKGIDLAVREGELVALVGANGAGKTTLLRAVSGVIATSGGSIRFDGEDITRTAPDRRVRRGIVQVPEGRQVFGPLAVEDNLRLGAYTRPRNEAASSLEQVYAMFPALRQRRHQAAGTLSGGQQQMLAMGRALMARPRLLLLDEPSMGLAPRLVAEIFAHVAALKALRTTTFLVDQNASAALAVADRAYVLETGRLTLSGSGAELLASPEVQAAYLGL
jgi:branched-chain amino acid transport system ATP-binding protein